MKPNEHTPFSEWILNKTNLVVNGIVCRIVEIEVYQTPDPYIHGHSDQLTLGKFYFRERGDSYTGGTWKGLDVTCGNAERGIYGGILIRSILTPDGVTTGPCKVVDYILGKCNVSSVHELVTEMRNRGCSNPPQINHHGSILRLENANNTACPIYTSPRIGLGLKKYMPGKGYEQYLMKEFRYTTMPGKIKGKHFLYLSMRKQDMPINTIKKVLNLKMAYGDRWMKSYMIGEKHNGQYFLSEEARGLNSRELQCEAMGFFNILTTIYS